MTEEIKAGDYVLCINGSGPLKKGKIYKIFGTTEDDEFFCLSQEHLEEDSGWLKERFIKV